MKKNSNCKFKILCVSIFIIFLINCLFICFPKIKAEADNAIKIESDLAHQNKEVALEQNQVSSYRYLYNLDNSADYIYIEFIDGGYAIYAQKTMEILEYSLQWQLPFDNNIGSIYYAGPSNYYKKEDNKFYDLVSGKIVNISIEQSLDYASKIRKVVVEDKIKKNNLNIYGETESFNFIEKKYNLKKKSPNIDTGNMIVPTMGLGKMISNAQYFLTNPFHGENVDGNTYGNGNSGTCGAVAAQIILGYNNYCVNRKIIPDKYLYGYDDSKDLVVNTERNPNYCSDPMSMTRWTLGTRSEATGVNSFYNEMISSIMKPNTSGASIYEVKKGISEYLGRYLNSNEYTVAYDFQTWLLGWYPISFKSISSEIDANRPIIISTNSNLGGQDHFVVGYGYQDYTYSNNGGTYSGYIVHYGWNNHNNVWINSSWCDGYVSLKIKHTHNYNTVGSIASTDRIEYKCVDCGHRTDAAINMRANERYVERKAKLLQNNYKYIDYYVTFENSGNKLFQTFGPQDVEMYLYNIEYKQLAYNDDAGYKVNSLFSYNVDANMPYILRIKLYYANATGDIKIGITPSDAAYSKYEDIWHGELQNNMGFEWTAKLNTTKVICLTPTYSGRYVLHTFSTDYLDGYLYFIDPATTNECIFDDDGYGDLQARIEVDLIADKRYFIVISTYNITMASGNLRLLVGRS